MQENPPPASMPSPRSMRRWLRWTLLAIILVLPFAGAWLAWQLLLPGEKALDGDLTVNIVRIKGGVRTNRIDEPDTLPVRAGDRMHLTARYNQPAFTYLLWVDCRDKVVPLYPWNVDAIQEGDADQPPPLFRPAAIIFNPMTIGAGWEFGKQGGLDTVLLLARRTPLEEDIRLGSLLSNLPAPRMRDRGEAVLWKWDRGSNAAVPVLSLKRGAATEAAELDRPLLARIEKLHNHFELIRAVRFAHEEK